MINLQQRQRAVSKCNSGSIHEELVGAQTIRQKQQENQNSEKSINLPPKKQQHICAKIKTNDGNNERQFTLSTVTKAHGNWRYQTAGTMILAAHGFPYQSAVVGESLNNSDTPAIPSLRFFPKNLLKFQESG
jgi:hypothetical protein